MTSEPTRTPLRILQVVTLISPDAAYGGPERVAFNQTAALVRMGHGATVAAAVRGYSDRSPAPTERAGVPIAGFRSVTAIPGISFAGLSAPGMLAWFARNRRRFDVVHVHVARDLVTLPIGTAAVAAGLPVVLQCHGMIDPSSKAAAKPLDLALTLPLLRRAKQILYLNEVEHRNLIEVAGPQLPYSRLINGVSTEEPADPGRADVVPEVVMLCRMHARKRPIAFVQAAVRLLQAGIKARFTLIGPDEGEMDRVQREIDASGFGADITWIGPLEQTATAARLRKAAVYVLPSVDEPYPMSVLEAMSLGLPVVILDDNGLAPTVEQYDGGIVVDESIEHLTTAIGTLIEDAELRARKGARARQAVIETHSIDAVASRLEQIYRTAVGDHASR